VREDEDVYLVIEAARVERGGSAVGSGWVGRIKGFAEPGAIEEYQRTVASWRRRRVDVAGAKQKIAQGALVLDVRRRSDEFDLGTFQVR